MIRLVWSHTWEKPSADFSAGPGGLVGYSRVWRDPRRPDAWHWVASVNGRSSGEGYEADKRAAVLAAEAAYFAAGG